VFDWDDLRVFLAVARAGSTIAAARVLGVSQPTVQRRLVAFEQAIGRRLVESHPTGYRLTDLGKAMLPQAERIEEEVAAFERGMASSDKGLTGTLKVTCAEGMGRGFLTPLLEVFRARYPAVQVELRMTDRFLDLAKGEADIALRTREPSEGALVARKLADIPWAVYASRDYVERRGRPERVEDLEHHAVIGFDGEMASHHASRWLRTVAPRAAIAAYGDTLLGLVAAARSGAGLAPLPVVLGEPEEELVRVLGPLPELQCNKMYLVMHRDLRRVPRVRAFCDFLVAEVAHFRPLLAGRTNGGR